MFDLSSIRELELHSVQFSRSVVSDSLRPHGLQHARPPCSSPTPRIYPNSCPLSWWSHPTISSSVVPFSSHLQSFPASESLQMSQVFASGGQSIRVSASTSVLPMNTQDWSPLGETGWDLLAVQGTLKSLFQHHSSKVSVLQCSALFMVQLSHPTLTTEKIIALTIWTFVGKVKSLLFTTLSRFVIVFLARIDAVTIHSDFEAQENKVCHCFHCFPYLSWCDGTGCLDFSFLNVECWVLSQLFHSPLSPSSRGSLVPLHFLP